jgi:hypothetical protein
MFSGFKRPGTNAGVGIVLKVGNDDELYVKSMQRAGPAFCSGVVKVSSAPLFTLQTLSIVPCVCAAARLDLA